MFKKVMGLIDKINQSNKEKLIENLPEEKTWKIQQALKAVQFTKQN